MTAPRALMGKPLRFLIAGAINTAFGLSFYPLLLLSAPLFQRHYLAALGVAQVVCLCFAYATYKLGVFRTRGGIAREFGAFSSFYLISYAANWAVLPLFVELARISPIVVQTGFTVATVASSWFWHTRITFREPNVRGERRC